MSACVHAHVCASVCVHMLIVRVRMRACMSIGYLNKSMLYLGICHGQYQW